MVVELAGAEVGLAFGLLKYWYPFVLRGGVYAELLKCMGGVFAFRFASYLEPVFECLDDGASKVVDAAILAVPELMPIAALIKPAINLLFPNKDEK